MKFRLIALALAALASPAFASTTASISAGSFDFTLKDLNAADGVAPSLTWDPTWYLYGNTNYQKQIGYELVNHSWGNTLDARYDTQVNNFSYGYAPTTSLSGTPLLGNGSYGISLDASGRPQLSLQETIGAGYIASGSVQLSRSFWLSAGTQVSFSMLVDRSLTGSAYTGSWTPTNLAGYPGYSYSTASISLSADSFTSSSTLYGSNWFTYSVAYESVGEADQIKLIIKNTTDIAQYYSISAYAYYSLQEQLDPTTAAMVPEPSSYALMALGLLGVGAVARRRKH